MGLNVAGYRKEPALNRLGPTLVIAAAIIVAVRTARQAALYDGRVSNREIEAEVGFALDIAGVILAAALARWPGHFIQQEVPWYEPDSREVPE